MNVPNVTNGIEDAANGFSGAGAPDLVNLPSLGPNIKAPGSKVVTTVGLGNLTVETINGDTNVQPK